MRRVLDLLVSGLALACLAPLLLLIALILRCTGEGEVLYLQPRVGLDGRIFRLFKFVTMVKESPYVGTRTVTIKNDPRVLPVGRILRKAKLNELPQLLNVLMGDMTLIGPRPLTRQTFGYYSSRVQKEIVKVKPGLTGVGSIMLRDEESVIARSSKEHLDCYKEDIAPYKGELELWYVRHRNLWLDLKVLVLTALVVLMPGTQLHRKVMRGIPSPPPGCLL